MYAIGYGWGMGFAIIMGMVLIVVIVYTFFALRKQVSERENSTPKKPTAELLREQYARGEISKEEYEARKRKLE